MIRLVILIYFTFASIALAQLMGFDGITNGGNGGSVHRADCLLVSGTTDCMLYDSGVNNIILVQ